MRNISRWREGEMQNGKLFRARSLGSLLSAQAQAPTPLGSINCGDELNVEGAVYELVENMNCTATDGDFALKLSASNSRLMLQGFTISADVVEPPSLGIYITGNYNSVRGAGSVAGFIDKNIYIESAHNNQVAHLKFVGGGNGIGLTDAHLNVFQQNLIQDTQLEGALLLASTNNILETNKFSGGGLSYCLMVGAESRVNTIRNNLFENASLAITLQKADFNVVTDNLIKEPRTYYNGYMVNVS